MKGICKVGGRCYRWSVIAGTAVFPALTRALGLPQVVDVLRICCDEPGFDVVIRIDDGSKSGGVGDRYLGPILCVGDSIFLGRTQQWPIDALLRLRPRLIHVRDPVSFGVVVERVVQWCTSQRFRAVRVKPTGSLWVDHESPNE